jgi:hypothetical protein
MGVGGPGVGVGGGGVGFAASTEPAAPKATITSTIKAKSDTDLLNTEDLLQIKINLLPELLLHFSPIRVNEVFLVT